MPAKAVFSPVAHSLRDWLTACGLHTPQHPIADKLERLGACRPIDLLDLGSQDVAQLRLDEASTGGSPYLRGKFEDAIAAVHATVEGLGGLNNVLGIAESMASGPLSAPPASTAVAKGIAEASLNGSIISSSCSNDGIGGGADGSQARSKVSPLRRVSGIDESVATTVEGYLEVSIDASMGTSTEMGASSYAQGYLHGHGHGWQRRYVVIAGHHLKQYVDSDRLKLKAVVDLHDLTSVEEILQNQTGAGSSTGTSGSCRGSYDNTQLTWWEQQQQRKQFGQMHQALQPAFHPPVIRIVAVGAAMLLRCPAAPETQRWLLELSHFLPEDTQLRQVKMGLGMATLQQQQLFGQQQGERVGSRIFLHSYEAEASQKQGMSPVAAAAASPVSSGNPNRIGSGDMSTDTGAAMAMDGEVGPATALLLQQLEQASMSSPVAQLQQQQLLSQLGQQRHSDLQHGQTVVSFVPGLSPQQQQLQQGLLSTLGAGACAEPVSSMPAQSPLQPSVGSSVNSSSSMKQLTNEPSPLPPPPPPPPPPPATMPVIQSQHYQQYQQHQQMPPQSQFPPAPQSPMPLPTPLSTPGAGAGVGAGMSMQPLPQFPPPPQSPMPLPTPLSTPAIGTGVEAGMPQQQQRQQYVQQGTQQPVHSPTTVAPIASATSAATARVPAMSMSAEDAFAATGGRLSLEEFRQWHSGNHKRSNINNNTHSDIGNGSGNGTSNHMCGSVSSNPLLQRGSSSTPDSRAIPKQTHQHSARVSRVGALFGTAHRSVGSSDPNQNPNLSPRPRASRRASTGSISSGMDGGSSVGPAATPSDLAPLSPTLAKRAERRNSFSQDRERRRSLQATDASRMNEWSGSLRSGWSVKEEAWRAGKDRLGEASSGARVLPPRGAADSSPSASHSADATLCRARSSTGAIVSPQYGKNARVEGQRRRESLHQTQSWLHSRNPQFKPTAQPRWKG